MPFTINDITIIQKLFGFISGIAKIYYEYVNSLVLSEGEIAPTVFFELLIKTLFFCVLIFIICLGKILQIGNISVSVIINTIIRVFNFTNLQELEEIQSDLTQQTILFNNQLREQLNNDILLSNEIIERMDEIIRQEDIIQQQRQAEIQRLQLLQRIRHNQILNSLSSNPPESYVKRITGLTNLPRRRHGGLVAVKHKKSIVKGGAVVNNEGTSIINTFINCLILTFVYEFKKYSIIYASNNSNKINTDIHPSNNLTEFNKIIFYFNEIVEKIQTNENLPNKQEIVNKYFYEFIQENTIFDKEMKEKVINTYKTVFENPLQKKGGYRKIKQSIRRKNKNNKTRKYV